MKIKFIIILTLIFSSFPLYNSSAEEVKTEKPIIEKKQPVKFELGGYYRTRMNIESDFDLDNNKSPRKNNYFQHRLRLLPTIYTSDKIKIKTDFLFGESVKDPASDGIMGNQTSVMGSQANDDEANLEVVRVWGEAVTPIGIIMAGRMPSHWGLGLLSNNGLNEPEFGDARYGTTYDRFQYTLPLHKIIAPISISLIYDMIGEGDGKNDDDTSSNADDAHEFLGVIIFKMDPGKKNLDQTLVMGAYQLYRKQKISNTKMHVTNVFATLSFKPFYMKTEAVWIYGSSSALAIPVFDYNNYTSSMPDYSEKTEIDINMRLFGVEIGAKDRLYDSKIKFGFIPGDNDWYADKKANGTNVTQDYRIGLIMYDAYANLIEEQNEIIAPVLSDTLMSDDPTLEQEAADATAEAIVGIRSTKGKAANSMYLNPIVMIYPADFLALKVGYLTAKADKDFQLTNGKRTGGWIGHEIDAGVELKYEKFSFGIEGGGVFPGQVLQRCRQVRQGLPDTAQGNI